MGGIALYLRMAKSSEVEKGQIRPALAGQPRLKLLPPNILRKFEQSQAYSCQKSEYLTLLNSFPDVRKSD
jgi:hypothetical protein